jgi:RNA polymerase sigma factor (sigma-70 family)
MDNAELELVLAAQAGDIQARADLVERFRPLVATVARTYRACPAVDRQELMQDGVVGLLRALERYEPAQGTPFWSYASWWVRQAMQRLVAELGQPVVLSDRALRQLARVKDARRTRAQRDGIELSSSGLAATTGLPREQIEQLIAVERAPRALDESVRGPEDRITTFGDLLSDPVAEDAYDRVVARLEIEGRRPRFARLSERERGVLRARFGFDGHEQTLREIAGRLGLSAERVRQIEQQALEELRQAES